jgi:RTX calcium-binding nonapeptide repeat (4 copies)
MRRAGLLAVAAWLCVAGTANAATISGGSTPGPGPGLALPLNIAGTGSEANHIEVVASGSGFIVRETGMAPLTNSAPSCSSTGTAREFLCSIVAPGASVPTPIINVTLGEGSDTFLGASQPVAITVAGGSGDDTLASGAGVQGMLDGGEGTDTADYSSHLQPVNVSLDDVQNDGGAEDGGAEMVKNVERTVGGAGADLLSGSAAANRLEGGPGGDVLDGGVGADSLLGSAGNDQLTGGPDADTFSAGEGDDAVNASDGLGEDVDCGEGGADSATADGADRLLGCETVSRVEGEDDAKPRRVRAKVRHAWAFGRTFARARRFTVVDVPALGVVRVTCKPPRGRKRACPFKSKRRESVRGAKQISFRKAFKRRRLPVGTVIEVRVTRRSWVGKVIRFKVRSGKRPKVQTLCVNPGKRKARKC